MGKALSRLFNLLCLLALVVLGDSLSVLSAAAENAHVQNIRFSRDSVTYVIHYDLMSVPAQEKCEVGIVLRKKGDESFMYRPVNLSGDIGAGITGGKGKEIRWTYHAEVTDSLQESDTYFEIVLDAHVASVDEPPFFLRTPVLIGAGAVVGGVLAILVSSGNSTQALPPVQTPRFAMPPGRP
jgi:hypothetical protein